MLTLMLRLLKSAECLTKTCEPSWAHFDATSFLSFRDCRANLRGVVKPEMASSLVIPYSKALKFGRVVRGEVTSIDKSTVVLADGQRLPYNYLVIGTLLCFS
jgi:hypothetical protein